MIFTNISLVYRGPGQGSETHANKCLCVIRTVKFLTFERKSQHNGRSPRNNYVYFLLLSCFRSRYFNLNFVPVHRCPLPRNYKTFGFVKQVLSPACVIYWHLITFVYRIYSNINLPCVEDRLRLYHLQFS